MAESFRREAAFRRLVHHEDDFIHAETPGP
jgi:hypothetical protein